MLFRKYRSTPRNWLKLTAAGVTPAVATLAVALAMMLGAVLHDRDPDARAATHSQDRRAAAPAPRPAPIAPPGSPVAVLSLAHGLAPVRIPPSFLGLSTEYWTLPVDERHLALYSRVLSLLHVQGDGPFILRIGGDSSDHTFYDPRVLRLPRWAFDLTPTFVDRTARIVRELHLRVILDLNLVTATPKVTAAWVTEAESVMPSGSIMGYEIGNEPNLYSRAFWLLATQGDRFGARVLPPVITPNDYVADYDAYASLIRRVAPGAPLLGPAVSNALSAVGWIRTLLSRPHPGLDEVTAHRYPYSGCAFPGSRLYPTINRILGQQASAGMAASVRPMVALARRTGLPARLTEFNSVTCGGLRGVSNSFATALWAPDAIFELVRTGLRGVNLHARVYSVNGPFTFNERGLVVRPLLYGLILFTRTLGPDPRLLPLRVHTHAAINLKAWAVAVTGKRLHVLLLDKSSHWVRVDLVLPAQGAGILERLLAPSVRARSGETLAGQRLNENGQWSGQRRTEAVTRQRLGYSVVLPPYSAALLSLRLQPDARL